MDIRQLEYFIAVAENKSFTAASNLLLISQPALSVAIRKLERELGAELLDRLSNGIELTEAGHLLLPRAKAIVGQVQSTKSEIAKFLDEEPISARIGVIPLAGMSVINLLLCDFRGLHPELNLQILEQGSNRLKSELESGQLDLAIMICNEAPIGCQILTQATINIMAILSESSPLAEGNSVGFKQLDGENVVLIGPGARFTQQVLNECENHKVEVKVIHQTRATETLHRLVARNAAVGFLPSPAVSAQDGVRALPLDPVQEETIALVANKLWCQNPKSKPLLAFLADWINRFS